MLSFYRNPNLERKLYNHVPVENFQTCRKILIKKIRISSAIYNFENITLLFLVLVPLHVIIGLKKKKISMKGNVMEGTLLWEAVVGASFFQRKLLSEVECNFI